MKFSEKTLDKKSKFINNMLLKIVFIKASIHGESMDFVCVKFCSQGEGRMDIGEGALQILGKGKKG